MYISSLSHPSKIKDSTSNAGRNLKNSNAVSSAPPVIINPLLSAPFQAGVPPEGRYKPSRKGSFNHRGGGRQSNKKEDKRVNISITDISLSSNGIDEKEQEAIDTAANLMGKGYTDDKKRLKQRAKLRPQVV